MEWAAEIASAMTFVLDLKPLNVLMDLLPTGPQQQPRLSAVVTDFGVSSDSWEAF